MSQPPHQVNPEISNEFRVYVALTALKHKPPEQSFRSYTLELRTKFPLPGGNLSTSPWKDHALSLERQLAETKGETQKVLLEVQELRELLAQTLADDQRKQEAGQSSQIPRVKKKKKSQPEPEIVPVDWNEAMKGLDPALLPHSLRGELATLNTLVRLKQPTMGSNPGQETFFLAKDCLKLIGNMLKSTLKQPATSSSHPLVMETCSLVPFVITQALHPNHSPRTQNFTTGDFIQTLHEQVLQQVVSQFRPLSESTAATLLKRPANKSVENRGSVSSTDLRPVLLGLCQRSLNALKPISQLRSTLSVVMSHSVVTELRKSLDSAVSSNTSSDKKLPNSAEGLRRIAFKDTFWYLVSVLHACFSLPASVHVDHAMSPLEAAARTAVLVSLAELLENKEGNKLMGLVERNMLIGVVEQAWTNGWVAFPEQRDAEDTNQAADVSHVSSENEMDRV